MDTVSLAVVGPGLPWAALHLTAVLPDWPGKPREREAGLLNGWIVFIFVFCMFNIEVPLIPWEIMAFEYAHNL